MPLGAVGNRDHLASEARLIPKSIAHSDVIAALQLIDRSGVPAGRQSRKFQLAHSGKFYPPKYVLSLACQLRTGKELDPALFNGGVEANGFLAGLGFSIVSMSAGAPITVASKPKAQPTPSPPAVEQPATTGGKHNERCRDCKENIARLLAALYGRVERNPNIEVPTLPASFDTRYQPPLKNVFEALQSQRGFTSFVRVPTLPRSDFFVPNPGFLFEFDESQHFTKSRCVSLRAYPDSLPLGFDRSAWMKTCTKIDAHDNSPPFRDEQRAWYDTLRDFLPWTKGMLPTIRVRADEMCWCALDPANARDLDSFRQVLGDRASFWNIRFDAPDEARLARISVDGDWRGELAVARSLLHDVCKKWSLPRVLCLSTCGAFVRIPWPGDVPEQKDNFNPSPEAMKKLEVSGRTACESLLAAGLREKLLRHADFLTVGIDTAKPLISTTYNRIPQAHAELVYVVNLRSGEILFTGKSYPTLGQERGLLRVADVDSHFVELNGIPTIVLGCHDLTVFHPRSDGVVKDVRRLNVKQQFKSICEAKKPRIVLHHPHTSVKIGTWRAAWGGLRARVPSVQSYLGTGCYSHKDDWENRDPLPSVLSSTKSADVVDIVVQMAGMPS